jgi:predicted nucleic-acid-binding Zn-ribbon protein
MKLSGHCPKCTGDDLFVVEKVTQPDQDSINGTHTTTLFAIWAETGERGFLGAKSKRYRAGSLEAWVCAQCGFTEWYARDANQVLEELAARRLGVRRVKARGGYR